MSDILVVVTAYDIPIAENVAAGLDRYAVLFFDPTLVDQIAASKLRNTELVVWEACPAYAELEARAHAHAHAFERELQARVASSTPLAGWQHLNLFYFFMSHHWYADLWPAVLERFRGARPHVFVNDNPSHFYWPSFLPALLLLQQLRTHDIPFSAVTYGERPDETDAIMDLQGSAEERFGVLTHLPTCFYDAKYFNAEVKASGARCINIAPKYWAVPFEAERDVAIGRRATTDSADAFAPVLDALLVPYIASDDYRMRQARHLSRSYFSQLYSLAALERFFGAQPPVRMLLSDHEAGFHGPLIAYAQRHAIPVMLVPHAKVGNDCDFSYPNITALTHPIQAVPLIDAAGRQMTHFPLAYPEALSNDTSMPQPLRTLGLLLSGLGLNGVLCTDWTSFIEGIKRISEWCTQRGVALSIRSRPGQTLTELLVHELGRSRAEIVAPLAGTLQAFAQSVDVCLMYDAPTSADIEFLRTGVPLLNPVPGQLSRSESIWVQSGLVPRGPVTETLAILDGFLTDQTALDAFKRRQFAQYSGMFGEARALRRFL